MTGIVKKGEFEELGVVVAKVALLKAAIKLMEKPFQLGIVVGPDRVMYIAMGTELKAMTNKKRSLLHHCKKQLKIDGILAPQNDIKSIN